VGARASVEQGVGRRGGFGVESPEKAVLGEGLLELKAGVHVGEALALAAEVAAQLRLQAVGGDEGQ
nr:hypothetical protein [Tanacetum cinerariifolium]